jgi:hypothetical protein
MNDDKAYDPARHNEVSPAPGFASTNTHNPTDGETDEKTAETLFDREEEKKDTSKAPPGDEGLRQGEQDS